MYFLCEVEIRLLRVKKSICPASPPAGSIRYILQEGASRLKSLVRGTEVCSLLSRIPTLSKPQPTPSSSKKAKSTGHILTVNCVAFGFNPSLINLSRSTQLSVFPSTTSGFNVQCLPEQRGFHQRTPLFLGSGPFLFSLCSVLSLTSSGSFSFLPQSIHIQGKKDLGHKLQSISELLYL